MNEIRFYKLRVKSGAINVFMRNKLFFGDPAKFKEKGFQNLEKVNTNIFFILFSN